MTNAKGSSRATGFVDAGALFSFVPAVTDRSRSDVMDSVLLAQLAADKKLSRFTKPDDWYNFYVEILGDLTWQITAFRIEQLTPPGSTFTLEDIVLGGLQGIVTSEEIDIVRQTIRTFNELPEEDPRVSVYEEFSRSSSLSSFIVDLQAGVTNGSSILSTVVIVLETEQEINGLFKETFLVPKLVGKVRTLSYRGALNEKAYASLRDAVIAKLGSKRSELILDLDVP